MRFLCCLLIGAVYAVSFFLPVLGPDEESSPGFVAFLLPLVAWTVGDEGAMLILGLPAWLANPLMWVGMALLASGKWKAATAAGLVAVILGLTALPAWLSSGDFPRMGYVLWVLSIAALAVTGYVGSLAQRRKTKPSEQLSAAA